MISCKVDFVIFAKYLVLCMVVLGASTISRAGETDFRLTLDMESRLFFQSPQFIGQDDDDSMSVAVHPEWRWQNTLGDQHVAVVGFLRRDRLDGKRSHVDLREAYWAWQDDNVDLVLGIDKVFWGVTESRHLVDFVNQTDTIEDLDGEDKLGQPMINLNWQAEYGRFGIFLLPYFREQIFSSLEGRFRPTLPVSNNQATYESGAKDRHVDYALRYSHYFGKFDLGLSYFKGTSREALFNLSDTGDFLQPHYEQVSRTGVDLQYTTDSWLWKLEAIHQDSDLDNFIALVAGFEYTLYQFNETSMDLGILSEYLYDARSDAVAPTPFDDDWFVGARLAFNDSQDTSILAGVIIDTSSRETFFNLEAERRIGNNLVTSARIRAIGGSAPNHSLYTISQDDYLELEVSWHF